MANGPRRVGLQQNTALETLERVLGIGQGIAQNVQANRDRRARAEFERQRLAQQQQELDLEEKKFNAEQVQNQRNARDTYVTKYIENIVGTAQKPKYENKLLSEEDFAYFQQELEKIKPMVNQSSIEIIDTYNYHAKNLDRQKTYQGAYTTITNGINTLEENIFKTLDDFDDKQSALGQIGIQKTSDELQEFLKEYSNIKRTLDLNYQNIFSKDKVKENQLASIQRALITATNSLLSEDQRISPNKLNAINIALLTDDPGPINKIEEEEANTLKNLKDVMTDQFLNLNQNLAKEEARISGDIFKTNATNYPFSSVLTPNDKDFSQKVLTLYSEGFMPQGAEDATEKNAEQKYRKVYFDEYAKIEDLKSARKKINQNYENIANVPLDKELSDEGMKGPLPVEIIDDINKKIVQKEIKNSIFKDSGSNNISELYAVAKSALKNAKTDQEKNTIIAQYNRLHRKINNSLNQDNRLIKANKASIESLTNNTVTLLKK